MPPKNKIDPKKLEAERLSGFLQELLHEEENKYCADCEAKQPRWASWNLGVFLCIRCAGLHRNLGVHISKVKSINLDTWTAEQVQSMRVMGNAKAKAVYEAELPQLFRRPQSDQTLEAFIRSKYETRRFILKNWSPPSVNASDLPAQPGMEKYADKTPKTSAVLFSKPITQQNDANGHNSNLEKSIKIVDLLSVDATPPSNESAPIGGNDLDDLFGPIVSATSTVESSLINATSQLNINNNSCNSLLDIDLFTSNSSGNNAVNNSQNVNFTNSISNEDIGTIHSVNFGSSSTPTKDVKKTNSDILALFQNGIKPVVPSTFNLEDRSPLQVGQSYMLNKNISSQAVFSTVSNSTVDFGIAPNSNEKGCSGINSSGLDNLLEQFKL